MFAGNLGIVYRSWNLLYSFLPLSFTWYNDSWILVKYGSNGLSSFANVSSKSR